VGFSAATGGSTDNHDIEEWDFSASTGGVTADLDSSLQFNGRAFKGLRLTPPSIFVGGSAFLDQIIAVDSDTSCSTQFQFKIHGGSGADGLAFMLHNHPDGTSALGALGGNVGYIGINPSLAVVLKTFAGERVRIFQDSSMVSESVPSSSLRGTSQNMWVDYDGSANLLSVYLNQSGDAKPASPILTHTVDLATLLGSQAYVGFSAATGSYTDNHDIEEWEFLGDNNPPTDLTLDSSSVSENSTPAAPVGVFSAADPDVGDVHAFTLTDDTGGLFQIGGASGNELQVAGSLDFETATSHNIAVRATDEGGLFIDKNFTITVTNVNEPPYPMNVIVNPVVENAGAGHLVGNVAANDPDAGDSISLTLTDDALGRFTLTWSGPRGVLRVAAGADIDYDSAQSHNVTVRATDQGGLTRDESFPISILNVNEAPSLTVENDGPVNETPGGTLAVVRAVPSVTEPIQSLDGLSFEFDCDNDGGYEVVSQPEDFALCNFSGFGEFVSRARVNRGPFDSNIGETTTSVISIVNRPPTAEAGGPHQSSQGLFGALFGDGTDPDFDPIAFSWDLDNDGSFETDGQSVAFPTEGKALGEHVVNLQVCDNRGFCASDSTTVDISALYWEDRASPGPSAASSAFDMAASANGKVYQFRSGFPDIQETYKYDPGSDTWTVITSRPAAHAVTVDEVELVGATDGLIYAIANVRVAKWLGGLTPEARIYSYDPESNKWNRRKELSSPLIGLAGADQPGDGKIYYLQTTVQSGREHAYISAFDLPATASETITPQAVDDFWDTISRGAVLTGAANGKLYIFGGLNQASGAILDHVFEYDPTTGALTQKTSMPTPRNNATAVGASNGNIYVFGGVSDVAGYETTVEEYNTALDTWRLVPENIPMHYPGADQATDGNIYAFDTLEQNRVLIFGTAPPPPVVGATDSSTETVVPGGTATVSTAPTSAGEAGITATLTNNTAAGSDATVTLTTFDGNPSTATFNDVGGGFLDIKVTGADSNDRLTTKIYYSSDVSPPRAPRARVMYSDGEKWRPVTSDNLDSPFPDTTENQDGTVSGGSFTVTFGDESAPKITELTGTFFSFTVDDTPPVVMPLVIGIPHRDDWYDSDATVSWLVFEEESLDVTTSGCETSTVTSDTAGVTFTCTATSEGGTTVESVVVRRDTVAPSLTFGAPSPAQNTAGWHNTDVSIPLALADNILAAQDVRVTLGNLDLWEQPEIDGAFIDGEFDPPALVVTREGEDVTYIVSVIDDAGNFATFDSPALNIDRTPPTPVHAGPFEVDEGDAITLDGTLSTDDLSGVATTGWDTDGDGDFDDGDPATFTGVDGPATVPVSLSVVDLAGNEVISESVVTVNNLAPILGDITSDDSTQADTVLNAIATFTDAGVKDAHTATWNWGDGNITSGAVTQGAGSGSVAGSHAYISPGVYDITLTVQDDDLGADIAYNTVIVVDDCDCAKGKGFWSHQFKASVEGKGTQQIDDASLLTYLAIVDYASSFFSEDVALASLLDANNVFNPEKSNNAGGNGSGSGNGSENKDATNPSANGSKKRRGGDNQVDESDSDTGLGKNIAKKQQDALEHTLAAWLNFAKGAVNWNEPVVDLDGDGNVDTFGDVIAEVEAILSAPDSTADDYKRAKGLAESVNLLDQDNPECDTGTGSGSKSGSGSGIGSGTASKSSKGEDDSGSRNGSKGRGKKGK
jgi:hypothetical protein